MNARSLPLAALALILSSWVATKHDLDHIDITAEARKRIGVEYYEAGHMMYLHEPSMRKFRNDLAGFIRDTDRP